MTARSPIRSWPSLRTFVWTIVLLLLLFVLGSIIVPILASAKVAAEIGGCMRASRQYGLGLSMYAADNQDRLPSALVWMDRIEPYWKAGTPMRCPAVSGGYGYGMTRQLGKHNVAMIDKPGDTVLVFESRNTDRNAYGDPRADSDSKRHFHYRSTVVYVDGNVRWVPYDSKDWNGIRLTHSY